MRINELLAEATVGKIKKRQQQPSVGIHTYVDGEKMNSDYTSYRMGIAVAGADGINPIQVDAKTWHGKKKTTHPYTKQEVDMLKQAYKAVGANYKDVNNGDLESRELDDTNSKSPVAKIKKNQYGV